MPMPTRKKRTLLSRCGPKRLPRSSPSPGCRTHSPQSSQYAAGGTVQNDAVLTIDQVFLQMLRRIETVVNRHCPLAIGATLRRWHIEVPVILQRRLSEPTGMAQMNATPDPSIKQHQRRIDDGRDLPSCARTV